MHKLRYILAGIYSFIAVGASFYNLYGVSAFAVLAAGASLSLLKKEKVEDG